MSVMLSQWKWRPPFRDAVGVVWLRDAVGVMWLRDEDGDAVGELDVGARSGKRGKGRGGSLVVWL